MGGDREPTPALRLSTHQRLSDSSWTPVTASLAGEDCKCLKRLVDLDGFEPSTSSMPCKKYQSLTAVLTENKRLSRTRFGRQRTPQGPFCGFDINMPADLSRYFRSSSETHVTS